MFCFNYVLLYMNHIPICGLAAIKTERMLFYGQQLSYCSRLREKGYRLFWITELIGLDTQDKNVGLSIKWELHMVVDGEM